MPILSSFRFTWLSEFLQEKTGAELWVPIHPQLSASLAAVPSSGLALLQRQTGQPYTKGGLDNWFRRKREAAQISSGDTAPENMAILGHRSLREIEPYTTDADQRRNAIAAMKNMTGTQFEQKLPSSVEKVSSNDPK